MIALYQENDSLLISGESVKVDDLNNTVTLSYGNPHSMPHPFIFRYPLKKGNHVAPLLIQLSDCLAFRCLRLISFRIELGKKLPEPFFCGTSSVFDDLSVFLFINYPSDCLFFRFSDLSFFSHASITHDEKLELSRSTSMLIFSIKSSGNLIPLYCDLLFLCPVAISEFQSKCFNTIENTIKISSIEVFKQKQLGVFKQIIVTYLNTLIGCAKKKQSPAGADNTYRASNHNVNWSNTMAMYKSTQTHPKFTFYFLAVRRADLCAKPCRQSITAIDERAARKMLVAEYVLFFAGRVPAEAVAHG